MKMIADHYYVRCNSLIALSRSRTHAKIERVRTRNDALKKKAFSKYQGLFRNCCERRRRKKIEKADFNDTGGTRRDRIHVNHGYDASETRTGRIIKTMTPAARESGREARRDNSKGRLIHTRNSFFYPRERRVIRSVRAEKREEESGRASGQRINYTQCSTTSAAMESKTSHLQSSGLSLKKPSRVEGHPYVTRGEEESV